MREAIIIGIIVGALFFAAGAVLSALAIKYATSSLLWDVVLWGSVALMMGSLVTLGLYISSQLSGRPFVGPALIINFGLCLIVGGFVWHFSVGTLSRSQGTPASPLDDTVQLACEWSQLPTIAPPYPVSELQLNNNFIQAGGVYTFFSQQPNQELKFSSPDAPNYTWRCRFSNFGKSAVLNMTAAIHVNFREVIKTETSTSSGKIVKSTDLVTLPFTLDATAGKLDIYVRNYSDNAFAEILLPTTAKGQLPGSEQLYSFKLASSSIWGILLASF